MLNKSLTLALGAAVFAVSAVAGPAVYVTNGFQFGTINLLTGGFSPIGSGTPDGITSLAPGPNGTLVSVAFNGKLESINPGSGAVTVGPSTGLADCSTPTSPTCGPTSPNTVGSLGGHVYVADFQNKLYSLNSTTGAITPIGLTGIPALPATPLSPAGDGLLNVYDESIFSAGGALYATMDAGVLTLATGAFHALVDPALYSVDAATGVATKIAPVMAGIGSVVDVGGTVYAFEAQNNGLYTLDLTNGNTTFIRNFDSAAGIITGAIPTPEPATAALAGGALLAGVVLRRRLRSTQKRC